MKIYIVAFITSLVVGLTAALMISGTVGPEIDAITGTFTKSSKSAEQDESHSPLEPAVRMTFTTGDELVDDLAYTTYALGLSKSAAYKVNKAVNGFLGTLDGSRPSAVAIFFREGKTKPNLLFCLPVVDRANFENRLNKFGNIHTQDGQTVLATRGMGTLYLKQRGSYMFISGSKTILKQLPSERVLFESHAGKYDIGLDVDPTMIPESLKTKFFQSMEKGAHDRPAQTRSEQELVDKWLREMESMIFDTKRFVMGVNIDTKRNRFTLESKLIGLEDSMIAEEAKRNLEMQPTQFGGFIRKGAGFNLNCCSNTWSDEMLQYGKIFGDTFQELEEITVDSRPGKSEIHRWMREFGAVLGETLQSERIDFGVTGVVKSGKLAVAMGLHVPNGARFEEAILGFFDGASRNDPSASYRPKFAQHGEIVFHQLEFRLPDDDQSRTVFGDSMMLTFGTGNSAAYLALGERGFELLKKSIDDSVGKQDRGPVTMRADGQFSPWLAMVPNDTSDSRYLRSLIQNSSKVDRISFYSKPIEGGYKSRLELEMGFVRIAWKSVKRGIDRYIQNAGGFGPVRVFSDTDQVPFSSMMRLGGEN